MKTNIKTTIITHAPTYPQTLVSRSSFFKITALTLLLSLLALAQTATASSALDNARELLSNPGTARQGIARLNAEIQSRDPARAVPASILLAEHLRTNGETSRAVTHMEPYGGFQANKLQEAVFPAYLEYTRCLVADTRIREAVRALDFAKDNTEGHQHARVLAVFGDLSGMADQWSAAIDQYKEALSYGDRFFTRRRTRESQEVITGPVVPGTDDWRRTHRPAIAASLKHAERQHEIQQYGQGFVDYRDARTAHLNNKYADAISLYNAIIQQHEGSVYAEAAQLYRAQCLAESGNLQEAIRTMEAFIRTAPLGLYRGEALHEIGRLFLAQGDVQRAERHFQQVLEWIPRARTQERDLTLYALPAQAARVAAPPEAAQTITETYILESVTVTPSMVINRRTAPWYLTRLEWDTRYYLGFIAFYRGQYDQALAQFTRVFETNQLMQNQYRNSLGSFHRRLEIACRVQFLLARQSELRAFSQPERLRFMLADFYTLWEKWHLAIPIYHEFLENHRSSREVKACALRALGEAQQYQGRWAEAMKYFKKVVNEYSNTPSGPRAILSVAEDSTKPIEPRVELLMALHESNPNSEDGEIALYNIGFIYLANNKPEQSIEALSRFVRRYPNSRFAALARHQIARQQQDIKVANE